MSNQLSKKIAELEHTLRVLEEENSLLTERAEDSLLLGLISDSSQKATSSLDILANTLEQISVLKSIPLAVCARLHNEKVEPLLGYTPFSSEKTADFQVIIDNNLIASVDNEPQIISYGKEICCNFAEELFAPRHAVLINFTSQAIEKGIFIFIDDSGDEERLASILPLLSRVVEMAVSKFDNVCLVQVLSETNRNLESLVEMRTQDLVKANEQLRDEMRERKSSQKALQESHLTLTTVLDSVDAMIYVTDLDNGLILFMNKRIQDELGADYTGKSFSKIFDFDKDREITEYCEKYLDENGFPREALVWQCQSKKIGKWFVISDRAVKWSDGRYVLLRIATDITLFKNMEDKLQHAQKMEAIGTLAGGVAHDFNNLLMGIQGRASLILTSLSDSHPATEHTQSIEEYVKSAADLTKQILGFARGGKYSVKVVDINDLVTRTCNMFGRTRKELIITKKMSATPLTAKIDDSQIEQVLLNLLINGWQAMQGSGELLIETTHITLQHDEALIHNAKPGDYCCIAVTDNGIGMDEDTKKRVFDPFFTTKEKERGTGLGLASAYGIINNHNGIISVSSTLGEGSTFSLFLPASKDTVPKHASVEADLAGGSETVLLVDDEQMIRDVGQKMLVKLGYTVLVAGDGKTAIDLLQNNEGDIDLVILDLIMPGMDGGETLDMLLEIRPDLPVLLSSGYALDGHASEVMARGCRAFLQKPFSLKVLAEYIRRILDNPPPTRNDH